ncbi:HAD hydrolase-like protein [Streptomyces sp. NPDC006261]|uniref:HAD family hydrolase n=1 Tax=Streptomyces sp. NPDC006261 TaxID=3156739 RepID=UPI0033B3961A
MTGPDRGCGDPADTARTTTTAPNSTPPPCFTEADVAAGRAAGVRVLGVATGRTTTAELDKAGATLSIAGLEDLQPLRALLR